MISPSRGTDALAERLAELGADRLTQKKPVLRVSRRGFNREARWHGRLPSHALVGIGIGDDGEHRAGILEPAAAIAAQILAHGAALDIDVMPSLGIVYGSGKHVLDIADRKAARDQLLARRMQPR